jgi:hypothetical protein
MTIRTPADLLSPNVLTIVGAAILAGSLAACGPSSSSAAAAATPASTSASAAATTSAPTPAAATSAAALAAPTPSAPATAAAGTATSAAAGPAPSAIAVTVPTWCINPRPVTAPGTLAQWLSPTGGYGLAQEIQRGLLNLQAPNAAAATIVTESGGLCQTAGFAKYAPPPVDVAGYTTALSDTVQATVILHNGALQGKLDMAAAAPYLRAGTTAIDAFLAAVGRPVAQ